MFGIKASKREFHPKSGEKLNFSLSNNGAKYWNEATTKEVKLSAIEFLTECISCTERMRSEIEKSL